MSLYQNRQCAFNETVSYYAQYTPPMPTWRSCFVALALAVWTQFATSSRRLPMDSVDSLETEQTDSIAFDYTNFDKYWKVFQQWRHYVITVEKVINIYQNSHSQTAMESVWSVSKLSTESVGIRCELVANCVHTPTRQNSFVVSAVRTGH